MRSVAVVFTLLLLQCMVYADGITVQKCEGDVKVRQGVTETWASVAPGDLLKPHDTMRTGPHSSAVLLVSLPGTGTTKRITLPPQVIVDMSDIRDFSQEELMLKLAMEKVRSTSSEWKAEGLHIPNAAVIHGENQAAGGPQPEENDRQTGQMLLNGVRVLYDNGFYATTILRVLDVFRLYPALGGMFDHHLLLAQAMERANLKGEALAEYGTMSRMEGLTPAQQRIVQGKMNALQVDKH